MKLISVKTPWLFKRLFASYVWNIPTNNKVLYLTFDDGPTPEITEQVLDILKQYNAKATFFCIGKNVELYPKIFQKVIASGHTIGNHTQNHLKGWKNSKTNYVENTLVAEQSIQQINKSTNLQKLFRPPYGQLKPSQGKVLQKLGYKIIMWDVLSYDWEQSISKEKVLKNVIVNTVSGSIIVFHDSVKASKNMLYALPKVLEHFGEKGYKFESLCFLLSQE